ncbi:MAG: transcription antitermination factor NusB [Deltaproteobacteria bacterium]|nr:MAG: transcription antitermination factor NusB [Deltaproteobacteria bacterium]
MGKRRRSRELALQALYQLDVNKENAEELLQLFWENYSHQEEVKAFSSSIIEGARRNREEIDKLINHNSENWRLERMAVVDRNILRMAVFELLYCSDIPYKVILNEAIEMAKKFGTEESSSFINGILDNIAKQARKGNGQLGSDV